ncbi:MAG: cysteine synthase A [Candidatus Bipolaricaulota bacterium]|nr:cysteine synthase A [Candidatus Bipolaricaulota bacterium]
MNFPYTILDSIGKTPLVRLNRITSNCMAQVLAKLESKNPMGSIKDRVAWAMVKDAEERGLLRSGSVVIEPTSGNTGIGLALACAVRGYRLVLTMPETMSLERRLVLAALGADIVLTSADLGMAGAVAEAERLVAATADAFMPDQFSNPANPLIHERTTAREIWDDTDGEVDIFVAGIGTGGTITGVARFLKGHRADVQIVGVEPAASPLLSEGKTGKHRIQGIGAGFVPKVLERDLLNEVIAVTDDDAAETARHLAREEGIFAGISSGAAMWAALQVGQREENRGKSLVVILPDSGERYISTDLWGVDNVAPTA